MLKAYCWVKSWMRDERGSNGAEYALLIALIALIIIGGVTLVGQNLNAFYNRVQATILTW